jgi:hypothetical protein
LIQEISDKKRINTLGADDAVKLVKVSKQSTNFTQKDANGDDAFLDPEYYGDITVGTNLYQVRSGTFLSVRSDNAIKTYSKLILDRAKVIADYVYPIFGSEIIYGQFSVDLSGSGANAIDYYEGQLFAMIPFTDAETIADETYGKSIGLFRIYRLDIENNILLCAHAYADSCFKAEYIGGLWQKYHLYFSDVSAYWSADSGKVYCFPMTVIPSYVSQSNSRRLYKMTILRFCDRARGFNLVVGDKLIDYGIFTYQYYYDSGSSSYVANLNDKVTELDDKEFYIQFMQEPTNMTVGNAIHKVIRYAGLESDGGTGFSVSEDPCSFKDLDTTIGTNYYSLTSNDGATYLELLEKMLSSVFGFMYLKNDGKYGVRLFESVPYGSQLWTISEDNIAAGSIDTEFDCSELKTRLVSYGPNGDNFKFETKDDNAILLNGDISQQSKNYLENQTTYKTKVFNRRYAYFSTPTRRFNFTIINNGYEIVLGDRIAVNFSISQKWLGEDKDFELFVIGVNKSLRGVDIVAIENKFPSI